MAQPADVLFIGIGSHVVAIDAVAGHELWRTKIKRAPYVTIHVAPHAVYAGAGGELFCLDRTTGAVRWINRLPGLGLGLVTFGESAAATASRAAARASAAAD